MDNWAEETAAARASGDIYSLPEGASLADAYGLQDAYTARVGGAAGGVAGFKLAVNGAAQMAHFGVSEPVWARLFGAEVHASGAALPRAAYHTLVIEPELLAVLGPEVERLSAPVSREDALACIARFHAAFELIDQRGFPAPTLQLPQVVAPERLQCGCRGG